MPNTFGYNPTQSSTGFPDDFDMEQANIQRRRAQLAQAVNNPIGGQGSGLLGGILNALQGSIGQSAYKNLEGQEKSLGQKRAQAAIDWLGQMPTGQKSNAPGMGEEGPPDPTAMAMRIPAPPSREAQAQWAMKGAGISPMTSKFAETALTNALTPKQAPKMELSEIYVNGKPQKVWVNPQDPTQPPVPVGGTHEPQPAGHEKEIEALMNRGYTQDQAIKMVYSLISNVPITPGGGLITADKSEAIGPPGPPPGGMVPGGMPKPPGMLPQGAGSPPAMPQGATPVPTPPPPPAATPQQQSSLPVTPNGPYAPPVPQPGVRMLLPTNNAAGQEKLLKDAKSYTEEMSKLQLPEYEKALKRAEEYMNIYKDKSLPGIGGVSNVLPPMGKQAHDVRIALEPLKRIESLAAGGKNLTANEITQIQNLLGRGMFNSEADARQAVKQIREKVDQIKGNIRSGYHKDVLDFVDNGGTVPQQQRPPLSSFQR